MKYFLVCLTLLFASNTIVAQKIVNYLSVPGVKEYTTIDKNNHSVLPSGRYVTPAGATIQITHDPFGIAVSPDGSKSVTLHNGVFTIINNGTLKSVRVPSYDKKISSPLQHGSFLGVTFAGNNNDLVYLSAGDAGAVIVYDINQYKMVDSISLNGIINGVSFDDSFTSDIIYNEKENELLVLDRGNFRLVRIDLATKKLKASIKTGRQPFNLALSPSKDIVMVANVGMYDYPVIPDITKENYDTMLMPWHPYGNNTKESINGTKYNGRSIPGVGDPLSPDAMSVFSIDLNTNKIIDKYKTGYQIGEMIEDAEVVGGASPNSIAIGSEYAYVSNATNDNISIIDYKNHKIIGAIPIKMNDAIDAYRGYLPFGITMSKDEKTLYVALLGFNAIAVVDLQQRKTIGFIPSGWGTSKVKLSSDEKELYVISCRGFGAGPNGGIGFKKPEQGTYIGDIQLGTFQKIQMPTSNELDNYTKICLENTYKVFSKIEDGKNPLPIIPGAKASPIKYVVYITKENRTYDEVLGQLKTGRGDSSIARYGNHVRMPYQNKNDIGYDITPNHIKLAQEFAYSDNFYCDGDASIHGHHWMMGVIPNEWVETNSSVDKSAKIFSNASGRRFPGTTGSIDPEDYAEKGGLWEALERKKISFYNFGEANETAHNREEWNDTATGAGHAVMVPMQKALWKNTSHNYAGFNCNIPDQFRMEQFEKEFTNLWLKKGKKIPQLITMQVPNDHTADPRPKDGYPYHESYVADNDLAVGRILHFLSRTPYWKNMLVIITEDDPQGGVDHIDAHRSILMMAGPYVKRNYTSTTHANFGSILKVIYNILGVPYVNQYDATASLLDDFFTDKPNFKPYSFVFPSKEIFNPTNAMKRYNRDIDWRKVIKGPEMDDEDDIRKAHYKGEKTSH
jgi:DNA-binding beta-propeller fold protein YncE